MRTRLAPLAAIAALVLVPACGSSGGKITLGKAVDRTETTTGTVPGSGDSGSGSTDSTIPDFGTIPDLGTIPGGGSANECIEAGTAFSAMTAGIAGQEITPEQQQEIEAARDNLPADIRDDYDTFSEAFAKLKDEGIIAAGEALSTPEVQQAQQHISDYIEKVCSTGG
ncbi:MAG: hypothetical protein U0Q22_03280 [Acidimicrobiales bacterium]